MVFDRRFQHRRLCQLGPDRANRVPVHASGPYLTPNYRAFASAIHTNGPISGAFRGFGVPQATIMQETLYDELAGKLGMDRLAFRQKNALRDGCRDGDRPEARVPASASPHASTRWSRIGSARWPMRRPSTGRTIACGAASASRHAGMAAAIPRCPTRRPSRSALRPTAPWCCTRARSISARARTP